METLGGGKVGVQMDAFTDLHDGPCGAQVLAPAA